MANLPAGLVLRVNAVPVRSTDDRTQVRPHLAQPMTDRPPVSDPSEPPAHTAGGQGRVPAAAVTWLWRLTLVLFFVLAVLLLALRELVLPRADEQRDWLAGRIAQASGLAVHISALRADWPGLRMRLQAEGVIVGEGDAALRLERVDAELGWSSFLGGTPYFHRVSLTGADLGVVREADGSLRVAGVSLGDVERNATAGGGFAAWLLNQGEVAVIDARLLWEDRLREAPPLQLEHFGLRVERSGGRYRFGLQGEPDAAIAARIDMRGDFVSDRPDDLTRWDGQIYSRIDDARLDGLAPWVHYPLSLSGRGTVEAWLQIRGGQPQSASVDFSLADFAVQLDPALPELAGVRVQGRLSAMQQGGEKRFELKAFELDGEDGLRVDATDVDLRFAPDRGSLRLSGVDLAVLVRLASHLPLSESLRELIARYEPGGQLQALRLEWAGASDAPLLTQLEGRFAGLSIRPTEGLPGVAGLTGELRGDARRGRFTLASRDAVLDVPQVFVHSRLQFDQLDAEGGWGEGAQGLEVRVDKAQFRNPDVSGEMSGVYRPAVGDLGEVDVSARLTRAEGNSVWRYLPDIIDEDTRDWLQRGILDAKVHDARLSLRGGLDDFPFEDGSGEFVVTVDLREGRLEYAPGWPQINDITASLRFEGPGLRLNAPSARIFGVELRDVVADLPDLDTRNRKPMTITGTAHGATGDFLRFVSESPVRERVDGFTDGMSADGEGVLDLKLVMPLYDIDATTVDGAYRFAANRIVVTDWLPPVEAASGLVRFSESAFGIEGGKGRAFGEPLEISARTVAAGEVRFNVGGGASMRALSDHYGLAAFSHLSGRTPWQASVATGKGGTRVDVRASLVGVSSSLPSPFNKRAPEPWPLRVEVGFSGAGRDIVGRIPDRLEFAFSGEQGQGGFQIERGGIAIASPLVMPERGIGLAATLDQLDLDAWRSVTAAQGERADLPITALDIEVGRMRMFGYDLNHLELVAAASESAWGGRIASDLVGGGFAWQGDGAGTLALHLDHLKLGRREVSETELVRMLREESQRTSLPDMDIVAEHFYLNDRELGRLDMEARNENGEWLLDSVVIESPDARFSARGVWQPGSSMQTRLEVGLEANDIGAFLTRFGYADMVRRGKARLSGDLAWRGVPTRIDYPTLDGAFRLEAVDGRFAQLEPGVGRLLGVLSLQALPRRLKLDFRDVFSEGFAFDRIGGNVSLRSGILASEDFEISGPAAKVWIAGTADVMKETQDLKVVVQPALTDSVAIGAAAGLVNPVAGVIAYLAQKIMNDPIERMFAYGYAVTGRWDDPVVERLPVGQGRRAAEGAAPQ